jgi:ER membrane protein complex subunit 1
MCMRLTWPQDGGLFLVSRLTSTRERMGLLVMSITSFIFSNRSTDLELSLQVALHIAYVKELDLLPYLALTTTTGAVQLWQGDIVQWTREEGLSRLQVAEMAELPERKTIASHDIGQDETFINRARRQLADAKVRF